MVKGIQDADVVLVVGTPTYLQKTQQSETTGVKFEDVNRVGSYNYTDLFTRSVEVSMYNGENYEPLVQPQLEVKKTRITHEVVENS